MRGTAGVNDQIQLIDAALERTHCSALGMRTRQAIADLVD
jgi:hypothetical protein